MSFMLLEYVDRKNEGNLRRNKSRWRHAKRGVEALEYRGMFVLPEIIKIQASSTP